MSIDDIDEPLDAPTIREVPDEELAPKPRPTALILHGLPLDDYYADRLGDDGPPSLSASIAKILVSRTPEHARLAHPRLHTPDEADETEETPSQSRGTLIHRLVLGAGGDIAEIDADDFRSKAAQSKRDDALAAGKIPLLRCKVEPLKRTADRIRARLREQGSVLDGERECPIMWSTRASNGNPVRCKALVDHLWADRGAAIDLKTLADASIESCERQASDFDHALQRAGYKDALEHLDPRFVGRVDFAFAFAEISAPNSVTVAEPDGQAADMGEQQWRYAVDLWEQCTRTGVWPGYYYKGRARLRAKLWTLTAWAERIADR